MSKKEFSNTREKGLESRQLQRRIRHLQFVVGRNIDPLKPMTSKVKEKLASFNLYFTLHPSNDTEKVLYQSEPVWNSVNPNWKEFDPRLFLGQKSCMATSCILCVWAWQTGNVKLMVRWNVDFSGLRYIGDQQRPLDSQSLDPNSLIFGMFGGYYTATREQQVTGEPIDPQNDVLGTLLKVNQSSVRWTYQKNSLLRVHYMLKALHETKQQVTKIQEDMEKETTKKEILSGKFSEKESLVSRIAMLREELTIQRERLSVVSKQLSSKSKTVKEKENELSQRHEYMEQHLSGLKSFHSAHIVRRESLLKVNAQLDFRRRQLVAELSYIYPIVEMHGKDYGKRELAISDIRLPDTEDFFGEDEDTLAVALGNTCHLVYMIAKFLELPLRYPLRPMGSRSTVLDLVTDKFSGKLGREFPLHPKSKDKFLFHYGLFLLNKNIGQLRYHNGMGTSDLRKTLPNLKQLFEKSFGVKVVYKKQTEILPHGFARQVSSRKGTVSSLNDAPSSNEPTQATDSTLKQENLVEGDDNLNKNTKRDGSKKQKGLSNVQKHSQVHKFMNKRGKRSLGKSYSAPDSSSSENLMEIPFEELLLRSNQGENNIMDQSDRQVVGSLNQVGIATVMGNINDTGVNTQYSAQNLNGDEDRGEQDAELTRTIVSLESMTLPEDIPDADQIEEDDISCIIERNSVSTDQVVLEDDRFMHSNFSRQLSDVLVIPEPFEMDHGIQHIQSQLGNRL